MAFSLPSSTSLLNLSINKITTGTSYKAPLNNIALIKDRIKQLVRNTYGLLTKREVKMAGYWPSSFFALKKRTWPIPSHLDLTLGQ